MDAFRSTLSTTRAEKSAQKSGAALSARVPGARAHERDEARRACLKRTGRAGRPAHRTIIAVAVRAAVWRANFRRAESISAARRAISGHAQIRMGIPRERPLPRSWRSASVRTARRRTRITPIAASANPFSTEQNILPRARAPFTFARPPRALRAGGRALAYGLLSTRTLLNFPVPETMDRRRPAAARVHLLAFATR